MSFCTHPLASGPAFTERTSGSYSSGMALRSSVAFCWNSSRDRRRWRWTPSRVSETGRSRTERYLGDFGCWVMVRIWFSAKKFCIAREVWQGTWSWCEFQLFLHVWTRHTNKSQPAVTYSTENTQWTHPLALIGSRCLDNDWIPGPY
jgi:hypothetical protein